jgi:DNA topoisomerase IA
LAITHRFTLLVVESPTVARIIRKFNIPYLEVIATGGFCWLPKYNWENDQLTYKADPDKREIRKEIKAKAFFADRIIIATDTDSAGEFIAFTISRYLKRHKLLRGHLQNLSGSSIYEMLEHVQPYHEQNVTSLKKRFICNLFIQKKMQHKLGKLAWIKLLTLNLLKNDINTRFFLYNDPLEPAVIESEQNVTISIHDKLQVNDVSISNRYSPGYPWNTAHILQNLHSPNISFRQLQDDFNHLFTLIPEELRNGLISYPRTQATGYYEQTWYDHYQYWIKTQSPETFLPNSLWQRQDKYHPHECIHPISLEFTPSEVRPLIRKKYYDIYRNIYDHHFKILQMPEQQEYYRYQLNNNSLNYPINAFSRSLLKKGDVIQPVIRISDYLNYLTDYESARPSGYGAILDTLLTDGWITIKNACIFPNQDMLAKFYSLFTSNTNLLSDSLTYIKNSVHTDINWHDTKLLDVIQRITTKLR